MGKTHVQALPDSLLIELVLIIFFILIITDSLVRKGFWREVLG